MAGAQPAESALYFPCRSCHGDNGQGSEAIHAPVIAGQSAEYIARQLRHYRDGTRGQHDNDTYGRQMALMAVNLTEESIEPLATYIAALPVPIVSAGINAEPPGAYAACTTCHGKGGEGNASLSAPRIAGQFSVYTATQLYHFREGVRGNRAGDVAGSGMRAATSDLTDEQILELADYLESL